MELVLILRAYSTKSDFGVDDACMRALQIVHGMALRLGMH